MFIRPRCNAIALLNVFLLVAVSLTAPYSCAAQPSYTGTWSWKGPAESGGFLMVIQDKDAIKFQLECQRGSPSYNSGFIEGTAKLEGHKAIFKSTENGLCEISFDFKDKQVVITQNEEDHGCQFGFNVSATGAYLRRDRSVPKFSKGDPRTGGE